VNKYTERWAAGLADLKRDMESNVEKVFEIYIRTTPEQLWRAITDPDVRARYQFGARRNCSPCPRALVTAREERQDRGDGGLFFLGSKVRTDTNLKRKKRPMEPYALIPGAGPFAASVSLLHRGFSEYGTAGSWPVADSSGLVKPPEH
jgi:hypothetical protein